MTDTAPLLRGKPLLGTFVEIGVRDATAAMAATDAAFSRIRQVQSLLSFHDPHSDLTRLNQARGASVELHPLSVRVIRLAKVMTRLSHHAFNCTVGGAMIRRGLLPAPPDAGTSLTGNEGDIEIAGRRVRLKNGVSITLDGIAKGFAVDLAISALQRHGVTSGWVNAGGDMRVFGPHTTPVHLRLTGGGVVPLGHLGNAAIASSRTVASPDDGFRGEIIGADAARVSPTPRLWTVIARQAWRADALTKVAANAPDAMRAIWIESLGGRLCEIPA